MKYFVSNSINYSRLLCVGGEREPGTYCSCMHQVFLVTCILLCYIKFNSVYLLKGRTAKLYSHLRLIWVVLKSETLQLWQLRSALLCSRQSVSIKEKDCVNHVPQLFSLNEHINNFCKQRAECLLSSIIHTECRQWQASFVHEKSGCLAEGSITDQILRKFPNSHKSWGNWSCANSVYQLGSFLSTHTQEPGNEALSL